MRRRSSTTATNGSENSDLKDDFFYINETNKDRVLENVLTLCKDRLKNYGDYEFFRNIQVITPTKKGMLGTKELNVSLQNVLNNLPEFHNEEILKSFIKGYSIINRPQYKNIVCSILFTFSLIVLESFKFFIYQQICFLISLTAFLSPSYFIASS